MITLGASWVGSSAIPAPPVRGAAGPGAAGYAASSGEPPGLLNPPRFRLTDVGTGDKILTMGQAKRPTCPNCGAYLILALPPDGKDSARSSASLKIDRVLAWLKSELQPPK